MENIDLVRSVAESVRYWAEGRAVGTEGEENLSGWCAIASAELWRQLNYEGIPAEIHCWATSKNICHVFLVVDDHVVCVTATQFSAMDAPTVYIAHVKEAEQWEWFRSVHVFKTPAELIYWQKKTRWVREQIAWSV